MLGRRMQGSVAVETDGTVEVGDGLAPGVYLVRIAGLEDMPSEKETRAIAQDWQPHRGAMAIFTWHAYSIPTL
mgnify:CR=1 FL=1